MASCIVVEPVRTWPPGLRLAVLPLLALAQGRVVQPVDSHVVLAGVQTSVALAVCLGVPGWSVVGLVPAGVVHVSGCQDLDRACQRPCRAGRCRQGRGARGEPVDWSGP